MELIKLSLLVDEIDATVCEEDKMSFYQCRIELGEKSMQMRSPLVRPNDRQEALMSFIEKAWGEISAQAFPPSKMPLIIAG